MERIRTIEEAKKKMLRSVEYYKIRLEAWEKVTRNYKKDGAPFSVLSKNFNNCSFVNEYGTNKIKVNFWSESAGYESDTIYLDGNVYNGLEAATTPDAVQARINKAMENYKTWLEIDSRGAAEIENQIKEIQPLLDTLKEAIKRAEKETNTHYTIQGYIKSYLGILND